ncbi:MAG: hypothetical protein RLZZ385_1090 [Pseudomonadota bacterium]
MRQGQLRPEVLLLKRNDNLVFAPGCWVFPGGRIDAGDYEAKHGAMEYPAACRAAVRETREEAGIALHAERLIHMAHWTTPENLPRRFSTWFFLYPLTEPVEVQVDRGEILDHRWLTPADALVEHRAGRLRIPHPTLVTLTDLQGDESLSHLIRRVRSADIKVFPPQSPFYRPREMGFSRS